MGVFEISEANRSVKCLELKAYDYMLRFDKPLNIESSSGTPYSFLNTICKACKVEMAQSMTEIESLPNGKETLGIYSDNDIETYRDLLYYVAQVLGCFCQINREGKLELLQYGKESVFEITTKQRYDSSYSDFVTRYTAVSSTNKITEEAEYYALPIDDGLTMNLGINPLLQFGLKSTRARIINNILDAVSKVEYVPFDSNTIGNPALDPGDILVFSGGHADADKISCITSITYKINGKHTLKCVGKNPKLSEAKSKNDKNISGLLNQIEENKTVIYDFVNVSSYDIGTSPTEVLMITFVSKEETSAMFLAEILLDITAEENIKTLTGVITEEDSISSDAQTEVDNEERTVTLSVAEKLHPTVKVIYKINGEELEGFYPTNTCCDGKYILTLFYPISSVIANSENNFSVYIQLQDGTAHIDEAQIRATISGQGLVAGIGDWNGRISTTDTIERIPINTAVFRFDSFTDTASNIFPRIIGQNIEDQFKRISITEGHFTYDALNERVTALEVVKMFVMDAQQPGEYNPITVEIDEENRFCLVCDYTYVSAAEEINSGQLQHLSIDTSLFERVEKMEATLC
jgi:hypothetical protein